MRILIACEYSARVRDAFLLKGHDAWSCDLLPTDGNPERHIQGDVSKILDDSWDMIIAHPPCTYLTVAAEWAFSEYPMINGKLRNIKPGTLIGNERKQARREALEFIDLLWLANIKRKCIENPAGCIPRCRPNMPKPQYIQQHWFGEDASKKTGLWLEELPPLKPTKSIQGRLICCGEVIQDKYPCPNCCGEKKPVERWSNQTDSGQNKLPPSKDRWKIRSTTPQGIADAMAEQWDFN